MSISALHASVVVVGAGPAGAALAGDLGRRGVDVVLLDKTDAVVRDARLHSVSIRTMELARHWGIEDELRNCGWPPDHPQDVVWGTSLSEPEIARIAWPSISKMQPADYSPTFAQRCPQKWFNAILLAFARRQPSVTALLQWEAVDVEQDADQVTVAARSVETGEERVITADYLVAADGARSGIRRGLGIDTIKSSTFGSSAEVIVRSPQLKALPLAQTLGRFTVLEPAGMSISLLPFDGHDQYRLTVMVGDGAAEKSLDFMRDAVRKVAGVDVEMEFLSEILPWSNRETLATRFREGRILLAGDAAHTMPTTGGLGMNTGVQDSLDLGWKLDAVLRGWGGPQLLDSYDPERREAVRQTAAVASSIYRDWVATREEQAGHWVAIAQGGEAAERGRRELGASLTRTFRREFNNIPASLGYRYTGSPICIADDTEDPSPPDLGTYVPTARPGHRAPHVWLGPGRSTLDVFGPGFTLVALGDAAAAERLVQAAAEIGLPLAVCAVGPEARDTAAPLYGAAYTLVRPDGHVAWRGDRIPERSADLLDVVRGAAGSGSSTGSCRSTTSSVS